MCLDDLNEQNIYDQRQVNQVNDRQYATYWSQIYSSHNSNIKYINSTIKYIDFELFHYTINSNIVSFFVVFSNFDYIFISIY